MTLLVIMLVAPNDPLNKLLMNSSRFFRRFTIIQGISLIVMLLAIATAFGFQSFKSSPSTFYLLLLVYFLLFWYYCRGYEVEKRRTEKAMQTFKILHQLAEELRKSRRHQRILLDSSGMEEEKLLPLYIEYIEEFRKVGIVFCGHIAEMLRLIGIRCDRVCLKSVNPEISEVITISRLGGSPNPKTQAETGRRTIQVGGNCRMEAHPIDERQVVAKLMMSLYNSDNHSEALNDPNLKRLWINRLCELKYLALGQFNEQKFPKVLSKITRGNYNETTENELVGNLRTQANNKYHSLIAMGVCALSSERTERIGADIGYATLNGFIGIDSSSKRMLAELTPQAVELLAACGDAISCSLKIFNNAINFLNDKQLIEYDDTNTES